MSKSINRAQLLGHLGGDPEIRSFQDGQRIASFRMATSNRWKDRDSGEPREHTEWHNVVLAGGLVTVAEKYLRRGSRVLVEGQLSTRKWTDRDGHERWTTEIRVGGRGQLLLLSGPNAGAAGEGAAPAPADDADDIPF